MRFSTMTLGCKANQYDTRTIERILCERGHEHIKAGNGCDVCIINTCAVTAESVRKSRQAVRRVKRLEPNALIAVCGCYSEIERSAVEELGVSLIGGTADREGFAAKIEELLAVHVGARARANLPSAGQSTAAHATGTGRSTAQQAPPRAAQQTEQTSPRTRALLKIQDGCGNRCSYCVIPQARGNPRSMPLSDVAAKAKKLGEQGYKEIVVTGIEISSYSPCLIEALQAISSNAPHARLRIGSLIPEILTESFTERLTSIPNLCNHFHISLQSGCDEVLRQMNRNYTTDEVTSGIERLRRAFDNSGITADLIVGFPGETDEQFEQTLRFIEKVAFSKVHIFPFSLRRGTAAAQMPDQISGSVKKERAKIAGEVAARLAEKFKLAQIGKTLDVLFETQKTGYSAGLSGNYLSVAVWAQNGKYGKIDKNSRENVKILGIKDSVLFGEIV